jgi:SAM-dependent methyltransferase
MGGYVCEGYSTKEEFFRTHLGSSPRHLSYERFLLEHLPQNATTLSVASGRAANELRLVERGWKIVCSDLEGVCADETKRLFPTYQFLKWNCLEGPPLRQSFDAVVSLSFIYLLDSERLIAFLRRLKGQLAPGGVLLLDAAGSPDKLGPNLLHEYWLPLETIVLSPFLSIYWKWTGRGGLKVERKHHGYRYSDAEIIEAGETAGFTLKSIEHMDFETEWDRSIIYRYLIKPVPALRRVFIRLGKTMPYVRMFEFISQ